MHSIESLELRLEVPREFTNDFEVFEEDKRVIYTGKIYGIYFSGDSIQELTEINGIAEIKRVDEILKKSIFDIFKGKKEIWAFDSKYRGSVIFEPSSNRDDMLFVYRKYLFDSAVYSGIILTNELFEKVFAPIEKQLIELYQRRNVICKAS